MTERKTGTQKERLAGDEEPMRKPAFTETMQIGIVVRDLDAAIRRYVDDYGIGPWEAYKFKPGDIKEWRENGQPAEPSTRFATAMVGGVMWELIQPLDDKSIFAQFLAATGGGVQHIAVAAANFDETLTAEAKRGNELVLSAELSGKFSGIKVAYLGTQRDLGVILEVFNGLPDGKQKKGEGASRNLASINPFFIVENLQASISYYIERMGFQLDFQGPDGDVYYGRVSRDGIGIMLKAILPDVLPRPNRARHEWARWDAFIYSLDPDTLFNEFKQRGVSFVKELSFIDDGLWGFEVTDADGYVLAFAREHKP